MRLCYMVAIYWSLDTRYTGRIIFTHVFADVKYLLKSNRSCHMFRLQGPGDNDEKPGKGPGCRQSGRLVEVIG